VLEKIETEGLQQADRANQLSQEREALEAYRQEVLAEPENE